MSVSEHRWVVTREELEASPSRLDGVSLDMEVEYAHKSCLLLDHLAELTLAKAGPEVVMRVASTAMVLLHRFFSRQSYSRHYRDLVASACFFLACKLEESVVRIEVVAKVSDQLMHGRRSVSEAELEARMADILLKEKILLFTLEFDIAVNLPYELLSPGCYQYCEMTRMGPAAQVKLRQLSQKIARDAFHFPELSLAYLPEETARCVICCAASILNFPPPHPEWVTQTTTREKCARFCALYLHALQSYAIEAPADPALPSTKHKSHHAEAGKKKDEKEGDGAEVGGGGGKGE